MLFRFVIVIACGGDTVDIRDGKVFVNGNEIEDGWAFGMTEEDVPHGDPQDPEIRACAFRKKHGRAYPSEDERIRESYAGEGFSCGKRVRAAAEETADAQEDRKEKRSRMWIPGILAAVLSVIVFFLTEDLTKLMGWVDRWTILMVLLLLAEAVCLVLSGRKRARREENGEAETA